MFFIKNTKFFRKKFGGFKKSPYLCNRNSKMLLQ